MSKVVVMCKWCKIQIEVDNVEEMYKKLDHEDGCLLNPVNQQCFTCIRNPVDDEEPECPFIDEFIDGDPCNSWEHQDYKEAVVGGKYKLRAKYSGHKPHYSIMITKCENGYVEFQHLAGRGGGVLRYDSFCQMYDTKSYRM